MPKRRIAHQQGGVVRATFFVACEDTNRLVPLYASEMAGRVLEVMEASSFDRYLAIVERPAGVHDQLPRVAHENIPPGTAVYATLGQVNSVLNEKYEHEKQEYRQPGHKSYVPPEMLAANDCVLLLGSQKFLAANLELYLERTGPLRRQLLPALREVFELREISSVRPGEMNKVKTHFEVRVSDSQFYPGNFNALWEDLMLLRRDAAEVAEILEALDNPEPSDGQEVPEACADSC